MFLHKTIYSPGLSFPRIQDMKSEEDYKNNTSYKNICPEIPI